MGIDDAVRWPSEAGEGLRLLCFREIQKSLKQSAKFLVEKTLQEYGLGEADGFKIFKDVIQTPGDGVIEFVGMQDHTADSVKSFEGFHRAWGEEAQAITDFSLTLLRPTIRWEDKHRGLASELWFGWNPRRKSDAIDVLLRGANKPANSIVVEANWNDNPWFPSILNEERLEDARTRPEQYGHIWEGGYAVANSGAYYAANLNTARSEGRVGKVSADPLMTTRAFWDIGGTGAKAYACAIWIAQFVGKEIRWLNYYEAQGQPLATHVNWLRSNGYSNALCILPHDGASNDKVYDVSYESALRQAGFDVEVIPNQGKGAAMQRVEAARRLFQSMWFNEETIGPGLDAIGWYHPKIDEARGIDLGPDHDWSSHGSDAFGLGAVAYEPPQNKKIPAFVPRKVVA